MQRIVFWRTRRDTWYRRAVDLNDQKLERLLVLEIDGPGVNPDTADAPTVLEIGAAFFALVQANAAENDKPITLRGLSVIKKCLGLAVPIESPEMAWVYAEQARAQLLGILEPPYGFGRVAWVGQEALKKLPEGQLARVVLGKRSAALQVDASASVQPLDSILAVRARPMRAGGVIPAVRFESALEQQPFTLQVTEAQARELGSILYEEVDIDARVTRDVDGHIIRGRLERFEQVLSGDPRPAWREWFKAVGDSTDADMDSDPQSGHTR